MPESPAFSQARQHAQIAAETGDSAGARAGLERAIEFGRAGLAEADPELLMTMRQLAALHAQTGDPTAARRVLEEASAAAQRLDKADPLALLLAFDLAVVAEELDNRHEARANFARVAEFGPESLGADHWAVTRARAYLSESAQPLPPPPPPVSGPPVSGPPASGPPASGPEAWPAPVWVDSGSQAPAVVFGGADSGADEPAPHRRRPWLIAVPSVIAVVAVIALVVVLLRPDSHPDSGASALADPLPAALPSAALSATPPSSAAVSPSPSGADPSAAAVAPKVTHSPIVTPTTPPHRTAAAITKITSPANGSDVAWATDVRYTMSAADLAASGTVVTVSICVSGRCYLDGAIQITGGKPVPDPIHLGSTAPEGVGLGWTLRLDRLSKSVYSSLTAQREAEIADSTWGDKGTSMDRLNSAPVSAVTVTKTG